MPSQSKQTEEIEKGMEGKNLENQYNNIGKKGKVKR